jgi:hypothetical protein
VGSVAGGVAIHQVPGAGAGPGAAPMPPAAV